MAPPKKADHKVAIVVAVIAAIATIIVAAINLVPPFISDSAKQKEPIYQNLPPNKSIDVTKSPNSAPVIGDPRSSGDTSPNLVGNGNTVNNNVTTVVTPRDDEKKESPEIIVTVHVVVRTGKDDKECGVFAVELFQGSQRFLRQEYGDDQDWNEGHVLDQTHNELNTAINGEPIRAITALEERPGQTNITWHANVELELTPFVGD